MLEPLAGDGHAEVGHVGEIRETLLSGDVVLTEDDLAVRAMFGAPGTHPALEAAAETIPVMIGMATLHLFEQGHRPQAGCGFEHGADLSVPQPGKGIGGETTGSWIDDLPGREMVTQLDAAPGPLAEAGFGGSDRLGMMVTEIHE
jgi:hypothetical protein